jgi:predicted ArsR family transcriptional regulator
MVTRQWTFITTHALVLLAVERQPSASVRELVEVVGVKDRQMRRVLADLEAEGYITRQRNVGRPNYYTVHRDHPMRHSSFMGQKIGNLISVFNGEGEPPRIAAATG